MMRVKLTPKWSFDSTYDLDLLNSPNIVEALSKKIIDNMDDILIKFLRDLGYRPKKTKDYMKGLKSRLKSKGLEVVSIGTIYDPVFEIRSIIK